MEHLMSHATGDWLGFATSLCFMVGGLAVASGKLVDKLRGKEFRRRSDIEIEKLRKEMAGVRVGLTRLEGWKEGATGEYRIPKLPPREP